MCWNLPLGRFTSTKSLLSLGFCPSQHSLGFPNCSLEGVKQVHRLLLFLQPILRTVCLSPEAQVSKTPTMSLGRWCWIPQFAQRNFC